MFYYLYLKFHAQFHLFNLFRYVTFRTAYASLTALFLSMFLGPFLIRKLKQFQIGQFIREDGPKAHQAKAGTPTMGGVLINLCIVIPTLLWADLGNPFVWLALGVTSAFAGIGFWDDYQKVRKRNNLGLTARTKFMLQILVSFVFGMILVAMTAWGLYSTAIVFPFFKRIHPSFTIPALLQNSWIYPLAFLPFVAFVVLILVGSSNAVNLTDGLDGLAIGLVGIASTANAVIVYLGGNKIISDYLKILYIPGSGELSIFCGAMLGASLGFLWYNAHPAEVFMGDVGSLSLGGALGTLAVVTKHELILVVVGGIFVAETLSVALQVASYKLTGKRIFKMAPIHHHFEQIGWPESKVIVRFWVVGIILALMSIGSLKLR